MVPHYSVCAKSKSAEFANSPDFPFQGGQAATHSARHKRIHHPQIVPVSHLRQAETACAQPARSTWHRQPTSIPPRISGKPSRLMQEPQLCRLHLTSFLLQRPKRKQPPSPDGCLETVFERDAVVCPLTTGTLS